MELKCPHCGRKLILALAVLKQVMPTLPDRIILRCEHCKQAFLVRR